MHRFRLFLLAAAVVSLPAVLGAQDGRGTILGRVTDQTGAVIAGAEVRITNNGTGVAVQARTNQAGNYTAPYLIPGFYNMACEFAGFKKYKRDGVQVRVGDMVAVDIAMQVGDTADSIEVKAETPLLSTADATLGHVVDQRRIEELPSFGGNALVLAQLAPGTMNNTDLRVRKTAHTSGGAQFTTDGAGAWNNEFTIDGVSNTQANGTFALVAYIPPTTAISEFKVQTAPFDASIGHTSGSLVNMTIKSGTNDLHGQAYWWVRNRSLDAPNIFQNRSGTKPSVYQDNRYGVAAGGPVVLPKTYNGRNRTFWFYAYEGNRFGVPQTFVGAVPTEAARNGDLSYLLKLGANYQVYDPLTTTATANGRVRQPIPGNIIPASRIDPVAKAIMKHWPMPNQPGNTEGRNNWFMADTSRQKSWTQIGRVDHAFSENHRAFVRLNGDYWQSSANRTYGNDIEGILVRRQNYGLAIDDVYVVSPKFLVNVRYGITYQPYTEQKLSRGFDLSTLGFSQQFLALSNKDLAEFPQVVVAPYSNLGSYADGAGGLYSTVHSFSLNFTRFEGNHNIRFGSDIRAYRKNKNRYPLDNSPQLSFSSAYTKGPYDTSANPTLGGEIAAFLLGIPGGQMTRSGSYAEQDVYYGFYAQDDWKLSPRLTVNLGMRYEYETPITERYNRSVAGYAFDVASPIEAQARANYAKSPIAEIPIEQYRVRGGLTFVGVGGNPTNYWEGEKNNVMPRIGLAFQLTPKTYIRAGYGMFFETIGTNKTQSIQSGFSQSTPIQASLDAGLTYPATTANPFPTGLLQPVGPNDGLSTYLGQPVSYFAPKRKNSYAQRWSFGFERELPGQFKLDASYVGNRGTRLPISRNLNFVPAQYLSKSLVRDAATISYLGQLFANPLSGTNPIYGSSVSRAGLLLPYPQFGNITVEDPMGYSWYHSVQGTIEKRFSRGYSFQLSFTKAKLMQATEFLNVSDPMPYETISDMDRQYRVVASGIWELPFGKKRAWGKDLPGVLEALAGGWQLTAMVQRQSGSPLVWGDIWTLFSGNPDDIKLPVSERSVDRYYNINAGFNRNASQVLANNIRYSPVRMSGLRGDGQARWDFSIFKAFQLTERFKWEFRGECVNAWNHPNLFAPTNTPTASTFGTITSQDVPRVWLLNTKLSF